MYTVLICACIIVLTIILIWILGTQQLMLYYLRNNEYDKACSIIKLRIKTYIATDDEKRMIEHFGQIDNVLTYRPRYRQFWQQWADPDGQPPPQIILDHRPETIFHLDFYETPIFIDYDDIKNMPKPATVPEYIEQMKIQTNDPQNVHDQVVIGKAAEVIKILRSTYVNQPMYEIIEIIKKHECADDALDVMNYFNNNESVIKLEVTDKDCFQLVWSRSLLPKNSKQKAKLQNAIIMALAACKERGEVVCVTGRVLQILGALSGIDYDKRTWDIVRSDDIRGKVMDITKEVIQETAQDLDNPAAKNFIATSPSELVEVSDEDTEYVKDVMRDAINDAVMDYLLTQDGITEEYKTRLLEFALSALDI